MAQDFSQTPGTARINHDQVAAKPELEFAAARVDEMLQTVSPELTKRPVPVALMVCHGMGQQVRFETLGQIAASVIGEANRAHCSAVSTEIRILQAEAGLMARAEIHWTTPAGAPHEVHVYEAYWAPVTEGQVSYGETARFLLAAAWRGLRSSRWFRTSAFDRFCFGRLRQLPVFVGTQGALLAIAAALLVEMAAIAMVTAKLAAEVKHLLTPGLTFLQAAETAFPGFTALISPNPLSYKMLLVFKTLLWCALVVQALFVRHFLIQYAGDVAAYISPYKASKFEQIRNKIQAIGLGVAKVIYGFDETTVVPEYERVVFAGHSLGSVLAYDTLNAVINLDLTAADGKKKNVVDRTAKLITFGSPLDKTAFLFRNQSNHVKDPLREQMAAAFQPLIVDYRKFRKPDFWVNLWSPRDIISGRLVYYDAPDCFQSGDPVLTDFPAGLDPAWRVRNIKDPACTVPLAAHTQYWSGALLAQTLYDAVG